MARYFAFTLLTFLVVVFISAVFASVNSQVVTVDFLFVEGKMQISFWMFVAFCLGGAISAFICTLAILKLSLANKRLSRKLRQLEQKQLVTTV